jgi:renalase
MPNNSTSTTNVLIIGGGLSGLMAATRLTEHGLPSTILEQHAQPGGRLSTWRLGPGQADVGAQFFTVRNERFRPYVEGWIADGLAYEWSSGWTPGSTTWGGEAGGSHPRYAVRGGMQALAQHLVQRLELHTGTTVSSVEAKPTDWTITTLAGQVLNADALILALPVPRSLALLETGDVVLNDEDRAALEAIRYAPCVCGVFRLNGPTTIPEPGALQRHGAAVSWIADNKRKGISEATTITMHASPAYSRELWDLPDHEVIEALHGHLIEFLPTETSVAETRVRRWPFALPMVLHAERTLIAGGLPPLAFAGDAFNGPRIEGAALSGLAAAEALIQLLTAG